MLSGPFSSLTAFLCFCLISDGEMVIFFKRVALDVPLAADVKAVRMHLVERMVSLQLQLIGPLI